MKVISEINLRDFEFWSGAADRAAALTRDDFEVVEQHLEYMFPDGIEDGALNDFFWFQFDDIAEWLGYENEEDMDFQRSKEY